MSTQERAYHIFKRLDEEQLQGFITLFGRFFAEEELESQKKRDEAYDTIMSMRKHIPDFDGEKELAAYREERYGK